MVTAAILGGTIVLVGVFTALILAYRAWQIEKARLLLFLRAYFEPQGENPSEFAQLVDQIADRLAARLVTQAKSTFMGMQSGEARAAKALEGDLAKDLVSQSPLGAALLQSFPALGKRLQKNPEWLPLAQQLLSKVMQPGAKEHQTSSPGGNNDYTKVGY